MRERERERERRDENMLQSGSGRTGKRAHAVTTTLTTTTTQPREHISNNFAEHGKGGHTAAPRGLCGTCVTLEGEDPISEQQRMWRRRRPDLFQTAA